MGSVSKKGAPERAPSPADEAEARALDRAVQTMIQGPLAGWDHSRPLGSLNRQDLRKLATAAITGWVLEKAVQARCAGSDPNDLIFTASTAEPI